jgi:hypothetical protein
MNDTQVTYAPVSIDLPSLAELNRMLVDGMNYGFSRLDDLYKICLAFGDHIPFSWDGKCGLIFTHKNITILCGGILTEVYLNLNLNHYDPAIDRFPTINPESTKVCYMKSKDRIDTETFKPGDFYYVRGRWEKEIYSLLPDAEEKLAQRKSKENLEMRIALANLLCLGQEV